MYMIPGWPPPTPPVGVGVVGRFPPPCGVGGGGCCVPWLGFQIVCRGSPLFPSLSPATRQAKPVHH